MLSRSKHVLKFYPVQVIPSMGGKLITTMSAEKAGIANHVVRRDFRRYLDDDLTREGYDYFWPNTSENFASTPGSQPFPQDATITSITGITRSGTTATATLAAGHVFVDGENVLISGAIQSEYNGTVTISAVTKTSFTYTVAGSPASPANGTILIKSKMPITLVHFARRPNNTDAVIVGTACRLYRFFSMDNGAYYELTGTNAPYFPSSGTNLPYYNDNPGEWIIIGSGYSLNGKRWEAESLNGYSIFNNGVDLPVTYRVEDYDVKPMYELRENGVSAVGTIKVYDGILMMADVSQIQSAKLDELFQSVGITDSGSVIASQSGTTVTAVSPIFASSDVGRWIVFDSGETAQITGYTSDIVVTVGTTQTVAMSTFRFRIKGYLTGSYFSGTITASYDNSTKKVTATSGTVIPIAGQVVRFTNGLSGVVAASPAPSAIEFFTVAALGANITYGSPYWIIDESNGSYADYIFTSQSPIFNSEMIGRSILLDNGNVRRIDSYVSSTTVRVDSDITISTEFFSINNADSYAVYNDKQFIDRIQYRIIWSMPNEPRRLAASVLGSIANGSNKLTLNAPALSFETGQVVNVVGAGLSGGNLNATIVLIAGNRLMLLDKLASTTVTDSYVQQLDSIGSIVSSFDLQDDSSSIIKMLPLSKSLIVYKDTAIFIGGYTGLVTSPFAFSEPIRVTNGGSLFYRHTLIDVNSQFHLYAGENSFWRFDLTNQLPQVFETAELCKNIFYDQATLNQTESIFAANNSNTKEIFFVFPSLTTDKILAFDYLSGEFSTASMEITAGSMVRRPTVGVSTGPADRWFVMAVNSTIVVYGLANENVSAWGNLSSIYYKRNSNPYNSAKGGYKPVRKSGLGNFGNNRNEKVIRCFTPLLSSHSGDVDVEVLLYGARNASDTPTLLDADLPYLITVPKVSNDVPCCFQAIYFQDQIMANILYTPVRIAGVIWDVAITGARDAARRPEAFP